MPHKNIVYLIKKMSVDMVARGFTHEDVLDFVSKKDINELRKLFEEFNALSIHDKVKLCIQLDVDTQSESLAQLERLNREQIILMKVFAAKSFLTTMAVICLMLIGYIIFVNPEMANGKLKDAFSIVRVLFGI